MNHEEIKALAPLAALDWLDPAEHDVLDEHLKEGCVECAEELRCFRESVAALALCEDNSEDDERIWNRIEKRLVAPPPEQSIGSGTERIVSLPPRIAPEHVAEDAFAANRRIAWWRAVAGMACAAALAIFMASAHLVGEYANHNVRSRRALAGLRHEVHALRTELLSATRQITSLHRELDLDTRVLLTPASFVTDLRLVKLQPTRATPASSSAASGARATITFSNTLPSAAFEACGLPPAAPDKAYELWWVVEREGPIPAGLFKPGPHGDATLLVNLPPPEDEFLGASVTLEPADGMLKPTGATYLRGIVAR